MKLASRFSQLTEYIYFAVILSLFFVLRFPSLFEPNWYSDEGIYQVVAMGINHGRLLYKEIWDNKPPLLYVFYAFFHSDEFMIKLLSIIVGLCSIYVFYILAKKLWKNEYHNKIFIPLIYGSTLLFTILLGLPIIEGNIANAENFMMLPLLAGGYFVYCSSQTKNYKSLFIAGLSLSLAFLIKFVAVFDAFAFFLFLLWVSFIYTQSLGKSLKNSMYYITGFIMPIVFAVGYFIVNGTLHDFINATLTQNIGYVNYAYTSLIGTGFLYIKALILIGILFYFFTQRLWIKKSTLFIFLWFSLSLFTAYFSQRPYTHYLLLLLPSFTLITGLLVSAVLSHKKNVYAYIVAYLFFLFIVLESFSFYFTYKTLFYYVNYVKFISNTENLSTYQSFFDTNTPKDYAIAHYINTHAHTSDTLFVWGNDAQIYTLTNRLPIGRYTVAYHMTASSATLKESQATFLLVKPRYVVISDTQNNIPFSMRGYAPVIAIANAVIYEYTY